MKKNSLALVIQARMGSSRFPGKAICDLSGATLLERIFQRVKKVKRIGKVILATTKKQENDNYEFFELGLGNPVFISAQEGRQVGHLLDLINKLLPPIKNVDSDLKEQISLAIIGMPNVGKSSYVNKILNEKKSIVSEIAGTTRDSIDSIIKYFNNNIRLIDTAGLRKKTKI